MRPNTRTHVEAVLASYDHPTGILGELVSQMADAFWWVKIYRAEKNNLVVSEMTDRMIISRRTMTGQRSLGSVARDLHQGCVGQSLTDDEREHLDEVLASEGHTLQSCARTRSVIERKSFETLDRLIERQLKNVRLLMQSYDSVRFAPQIHKKMALEIEQLELQVKQSREDQRLEVDRQ